MGDFYKQILKYIKLRDRSSSEIIVFLKEKGVSETLINRYIQNLQEDHLIDDHRFTKNRIHYRLNSKYWGIHRIKTELLLVGIAKEIINEELDRIDEEQWLQSCIHSIEKRKFDRQSPGAIANLKKKLLAVGHEEAIIHKAFKQLDISSEFLLEY